MHNMDAFSRALIERDHQIQLPKNNEVQRIQRAIESTLSAILKKVQEKDWRLVGNLLRVGSYFNDLKLYLPDEFDFLYELQTVRENEHFEVRPSGFRGRKNMWRTPKGSAVLKKIEMKSCIFQNSDEELNWLHKTSGCEYVLDPVRVKNTLFYAVSDTISTMNPSDFPKYLTVDKAETTFVYGPAVTLFFNWNGRFFKNLKISVDLTVCIKASKWEDHIDATDHMNERSILKEILTEKFKCHGYHLVPYISDRGHIQWKISTSFIEAQILSCFPRDSKLKRTIRLVKDSKYQFLRFAPNLDHLKEKSAAAFIKLIKFYSGGDYDENLKNMVSSYLIYNVVFHVIGYVSSEDYMKVPLSCFYLQVLSFLYRVFRNSCAKGFFISGFKLRVPEFGDILPGFHRMFREIDIHCLPGKGEMGLEQTLNLIDSEPLNIDAIKTYVKITKDDIDVNYNNIWENENQ